MKPRNHSHQWVLYCEPHPTMPTAKSIDGGAPHLERCRRASPSFSSVHVCSLGAFPMRQHKYYATHLLGGPNVGEPLGLGWDESKVRGALAKLRVRTKKKDLMPLLSQLCKEETIPMAPAAI